MRSRVLRCVLVQNLCQLATHTVYQGSLIVEIWILAIVIQSILSTSLYKFLQIGGYQRDKYLILKFLSVTHHQRGVSRKGRDS
ncbi:hypothetical protein FGO68_gene2618 [Halteria grandinella]|uniref:Uncharacterized protein n=1 Tax=Halteria grandinella TaxID=5974 RepID=A0A8J8SYQ7_HALGN|nr:hypothetical protein FGO68_gene2618 [Halteria grandinella]